MIKQRFRGYLGKINVRNDDTKNIHLLKLCKTNSKIFFDKTQHIFDYRKKDTQYSLNTTTQGSLNSHADCVEGKYCAEQGNIYVVRCSKQEE